MIKPVGLINGHYECRSFEETIPILTDILALEVVDKREGEITLKHPNTEWRVIAHEGGPNAPDKPLRNHYGVRVATNQEVDRAFDYLDSKKKEFRIKIIKPKEYHNAYSVHFLEPGGNFWEIESYENAVKAGIGKTTSPHWEKSLPQDKFPGKSYVPQALTHGTIECEDLEASRRFYENVFGLEIVKLWPSSFYAKHPSTPWYIVCLTVPKENRKYLGRLQRFTIAVESMDAVKETHRRLKEGAEEWGITEIEDVKENSEGASFLLSDLNKNWWEIISSLQ
jgi:catechol 2,3-dioxygenase-like lactoylglutathione lyase family enzyme